MKNGFLILILLSLTISITHAQKKKLVGEWKMTEIDGKAFSQSDQLFHLCFFKDGTFTIDQPSVQIGTWTLNKENTEIEVNLDNGDEELLKIIAVTKKSIKLDNEGSVATFVKVGKAKIEKIKMNKTAKKLMGSWQVVDEIVEGTTVPKPIENIWQFNKNGTLWTTFLGGKAAYWNIDKENKLTIKGDDIFVVLDVTFGLKDTLSLQTDRNNDVLKLIPTKEKLTKPSTPLQEEPSIVPEIHQQAAEMGKEPNAISVKTTDIVGHWKVVKIKIDEYLMEIEDRKMTFSISADGNFETKEDGELLYSGNWELLHENSALSFKDTDSNAKQFNIIAYSGDELQLQDDNSTLYLKK